LRWGRVEDEAGEVLDAKEEDVLNDRSWPRRAPLLLRVYCWCAIRLARRVRRVKVFLDRPRAALWQDDRKDLTATRRI
jgi:hypothetical protein